MSQIILFEDEDAADPGIRARHMPEHLAFLQRHQSHIQAAGPLSTLAGQGAGGMWLLPGNDMAQGERLIREDPLWATGLRKSYKILTWTQVFCDGKCAVL